MIKLKPRPPVPVTLLGATVEATKRTIQNKVASGVRVKSDDFPSHWLEDDVRVKLWKHHENKCCYCERKRELKYESDVEHFRPKAAVFESRDHSGYWWLAYDWTNYLYACKPCNEAHKKNHFPLMASSKYAMTPEEDLSCEHPYLVNPIDEDPKDFIGFDWQMSYGLLVKAVGLDDRGRGQETIRLMQLNRQTLMEERAELVEVLENVVLLLKIYRHRNDSTELP